MAKLGWNEERTDENLLPIIEVCEVNTPPICALDLVPPKADMVHLKGADHDWHPPFNSTTAPCEL